LAPILRSVSVSLLDATQVKVHEYSYRGKEAEAGN
jgi:hypothetical protein